MNGKLNERIIRQFKENFATDCIGGILLGYAKMRADNQYKCYWFEDKLTAHLVCKMRETGFFAEKDIFIIPQAPLYDDDVVYGEGDPANSPRIDFKFGRNWSKNEYNYYAEAKNLSEFDWQKPSKRTVRSYGSRKYYVSDGISRYLSGYYPEGCLIGYVVNGSVSGVVSTINRLIIHRNVKTQIGLIERDTSSTSDCCYISDNQSVSGPMSLRHLFLQLA